MCTSAVSCGRLFGFCVQVSLYVLVVIQLFIHVDDSVCDGTLNRRPIIANHDSCKACPDLQENKAQETFDVFSENLRHSNKDVRLQTIRILCHFETLSPNPSLEKNPPKKKQKTEMIQKSSPKRNVSRYLKPSSPNQNF